MLFVFSSTCERSRLELSENDSRLKPIKNYKYNLIYYK